MASHSSIVGSSIIGFRKYSQGCSCIHCRPPSKFQSSIVIPLPIQHLTFQLNWPTGTRTIGCTVGQPRLKTAKIINFSKFSVTTLAYIVTPQWNLDHSYPCPPSITSKNFSQIGWQAAQQLTAASGNPDEKLPFSLYHQKSPLTKVFYISTDCANFRNMRSQ